MDNYETFGEESSCESGQQGAYQQQESYQQTPTGGGGDGRAQMGLSGGSQSLGGPITPEIADGALGSSVPRCRRARMRWSQSHPGER